MERVAREVIRRWCESQLERHALLRVEGLEHIPTQGPAMLVCRHVHHLYDGYVLLSVIPRLVQLYIALDWLPLKGVRRAAETACRLVGWPVVLRSYPPGRSSRFGPRPPEIRRSVRRSVRSGVNILTSGGVLAIFPEGYPNIDPVYTPKQSLEEHSAFLPGFAVLIERAQAGLAQPIPVIPVGFNYSRGERWSIVVRCGPACFREPHGDRESFVSAIQTKVVQLSRPQPWERGQPARQ